MTAKVILTAVGSDRPGLTEALAAAVLRAGGNWLESHLARLGGKFVGSVLVELPSAAGVAPLAEALAAVDAVGLKVDLVPAAAADDPAPDRVLEIALVGQDRPGIVHELSTALARLGVNIDALETQAEQSAWSGAPLFRAEVRAALPPGVDRDDVRQALEALSGDMMVDFAD